MFKISEDDWASYLKDRKESGHDPYPIQEEKYSSTLICEILWERPVCLLRNHQIIGGRALLIDRAGNKVNLSSMHQVFHWDSPIVRYQEPL